MSTMYGKLYQCYIKYDNDNISSNSYKRYTCSSCRSTCYAEGSPQAFTSTLDGSVYCAGCSHCRSCGKVKDNAGGPIYCTGCLVRHRFI